MNWTEYITTDENILNGKPVIKGTRLSVEFVIDLLSQGWTEKEIIENYPSINSDIFKAIFSYTLECVKNEKVFQLKKVI